MRNNLIGKKAKPHPTFCRAKCAIGNKKGFSYVLTCVCILVVMMLVAIALQYAQLYHIGVHAKKEAKLIVDSYITKCAIEHYDALKQGEPYVAYIDMFELVRGAKTELSYVRTQNAYTASFPEVVALSEHAFGVKVSYVIAVPFEVFGEVVAMVSIPIEFESQYKERWD